jgi:hypothetical protein
MQETQEMRDPRGEEGREPQRVESEFFTQLQELRDRIRLWEAKNGDSDFRNPPS